MKQDFHTAKLLEKTIEAIRSELHELQLQYDSKKKVVQNYRDQIYSLKEDYHAVIPKNCKTHSEWNYCGKNEIPWSQVRMNRYLARDLQLCCNTYQESYHIVPLTSEEITAYEEYIKTAKF